MFGEFIRRIITQL
ncbi:hypothetical protein DNTS_020841 [Danionella cerebrum]|uniref:Uncharacterized protein n=1 Tax=Danionella cerebrum TaxID=2873325 RepID=A0A553RPF8_9TELE|nr:hypothetical protein DNTS_020841 [Danionella translucida]